MVDFAHEFTDKAIGEIARAMTKEYSKAGAKIAAEMASQMADYSEGLSVALESGTVDEWLLAHQVEIGRALAIALSVAAIAVAADKMALAMANERVMNVRLENADFMTFVMGAKRMAYSDDDLVGGKKVSDILGDVAVNEQRDMSWNVTKLSTIVVQGMSDGMTVEEIAKRAESVLDMDMRSAMRATRTAMTRAESVGRLEALQKMADGGAKVEKMWVAVHDNRTRASHRYLDGQHVPLGESFVTETGTKIAFPGDPDCPEPSEIYNCRCTIHPWDGDSHRATSLGSLSYEDWLAWKQQKRS